MWTYLRTHNLGYVSRVPEVSFSQIWGINVVQKGGGELKCPKLAKILTF